MKKVLFLSFILVFAAQLTVFVHAQDLIDKYSIFDVSSWGNADEIGIFAMLGIILSIIFAVLVVLWFFVAILAGLKIIRSQGEPEGLQKGTKRIQILLTGITFGLLFFIAVSVIGSLAGVGTIFEWSDSLRDCSCKNTANGTCYTYLFQAQASVEGGDSLDWQCVEGAGWQQ